MEVFGKKLKKLMLEKNVTQIELAEKLGIKKRQQISKWATGASIPRPETIKKIADALGVPVAYFLDESISNSVVGNAAGRDMRIHNGPVASPGCADKLEILSLKLDMVLEMLRNMKK